MSLFRSGKGGAPERRGEGEGAAQEGSASMEQALDSLAVILRIWGAHAIEIPDRTAHEVQAFCEAWARHVLLATEPPEVTTPLAAGQRDWVGLERALSQLRQLEVSHVQEAQGELRHVISVCIQALGKASSAEARSDAELSERIESLRESAQGNDVTALRQEVIAAVSLLDRHMEARRTRHQRQVELLSEQLKSMTAAFVRERKAGQRDALTKVYCRATMDEHLTDLCQMAQVIKPTAVLFLMDIDHFKWVNDQFGHSVGDEVLQRVAASLRQTFRGRGDFVARYAGDEFVAVVEEATLESGRSIGECLLEGVRAVEATHGDEKIRVGLSVGIAKLELGDTPRDWLDRADKALYAAKQAGRDRLVVAE